MRLTALLCVLLIAACSPSEPAPPDQLLLVSVDNSGALLMDGKSGSFRGIDRTGREIWSDSEAFTAGADVRCLERCPDVVLSGPASSRQVIAGTASVFPAQDVRILNVLSARSPDDVVAVVESPAGAELYVRRANGERLHSPLTAPEMAWVENPSRTAALALPRNPEAGGKVHALRRDVHGWQLLEAQFASTGVWDACVAGDGELAVLTGPGAFMIAHGQRRDLRTDLGEVAECVLGRQGGAVVRRTMSGDGSHRTEIRGIDTEGRQTWSRGYRAEVQLSADPGGHLIALVHSGKLELVGAGGKTVSTKDGVESAQFATGGELVTVESGSVRWHKV